jgi:hypothetical protein
MTGEVVDKISNLTIEGTAVENINGVDYSRIQMYEIRPKIDYPTIAEFSELEQLRDFCAWNVDGIPLDKCQVLIESPQALTLVEKLNKRNVRPIYATVHFDHQVKLFNFGEWYSQAEFIIALKSQFLQSPNTELLLKYASKVVISDENQIEDNGVSQNVAVKRGTSSAIVERQEVPDLIELTPWRTFSGAKQVAADYVFRIDGGHGVPRFRLIEADGGRWRLAQKTMVANAMRSLFQDQGLSIPVV